jgi:hypothetical protein
MWFPVKNHSEVDLRLFGHSTLDISYFHYDWQPASYPEETASRQALVIQP